MATLLLLRHAKSAWPPGVPDLQRPLNERGRRDAPAAGRLIATGPAIDLALVSPAERTAQTYSLLAAELPAPPQLRVEPALYEASVEGILTVLAGLSADVQTALVVGHNPGIEDTALFLSAPTADDDYAHLTIKYPTAAVARIELPGGWGDIAEGAGNLVSFDVPRG